MSPELVASLTTLLLIACAIAIVAEWFKQPYTIALILVGLVVALTGSAPSVFISHDIIFTLILPPLLFYGAMHMDLEQLRNNWRITAMLAIPGVLITTCLIGVVFHYLLGFDWLYALLFGALIAPTDPVSVLSILKRVGAPQRLRVMIEGESLFNDGTGVVIFSIILGLIVGGGSGHGHEVANVVGSSNISIIDAIYKFIFVAGGGTIVGIICGSIAFLILKRLDKHLLEVAITVILTFGTPLLAEAVHCSGIIAVVVAGMIIGNYGRVYSMSKKTRETLDNFWEVIDFIINSILFLVIGLELRVVIQDGAYMIGIWKPIVVAIVAVLFARLVVVYPVVWIKRRIVASSNTGEDIKASWAHVLFWGGLKGSMSIALVVGLPPDVMHRSLFLTLAFAVVLFSLIVQGLTMKPLVKSLGLSN